MSDNQDGNNILDRLAKIDCNGLRTRAEDAHRANNLVFSIDDLRTAKNQMDALVRVLFVIMNIDNEEFSSRFNEFCIPAASQKKSTVWNNLSRTIRSGGLTDKALCKLCNYTGLDIVSMSITVRDRRTSNIITVNTDDIRTILCSGTVPPAHVKNDKNKEDKSDPGSGNN